MTQDKAMELLSFHSSRNEDIENPLWDSGFVRLLRPFKEIKYLEIAFHEIMQIILVLEKYFKKNELDRGIVSDLWSIVALGKMWGYSNHGVFSKKEQNQIESYVDHISYTVFSLLDGSDVTTAFEMYYYDYPTIK